MNKYVTKKIAICIAMVVLVNFGLLAQEKNDAIRAFNASVEVMKTDPAAAIELFEDCIKTCEQVGDSAFEIQYKAEQVLPGLYYQKALNLLTEDKKIEESLTVAKKTLQVAEKYNNQKVKDNIQKVLIQAYSNMASGFLAENDYEKAIQAYDSLLMINPEHLTVLYNKALIYRGMDNKKKFEETIDIYNEKLKAVGDTQKIQQANDLACDYFRIAASKANQDNELTNALNLLNTASKYNDDPNVSYLYANIYNKQKKYSLAAESAQKGLELETGSAEDKAKFYYELGSAQAGLGDTGKACASFKKSLYGPFLEASKAQRTNLKCQ
ncbi:MAG: hypothetical protein JW973_02145 [Bacteroidales bacterium]|nr:hypothetical protein [Bacteroidales bacterium]